MRLSKIFRREKTNVSITKTTTFNAPGEFEVPFGKTVVKVSGRGESSVPFTPEIPATYNPTVPGNYANTNPATGSNPETNPATGGNYANTNTLVPAYSVTTPTPGTTGYNPIVPGYTNAASPIGTVVSGYNYAPSTLLTPAIPSGSYAGTQLGNILWPATPAGGSLGYNPTTYVRGIYSSANNTYLALVEPVNTYTTVLTGDQVFVYNYYPGTPAPSYEASYTVYANVYTPATYNPGVDYFYNVYTPATYNPVNPGNANYNQSYIAAYTNTPTPGTAYTNPTIPDGTTTNYPAIPASSNYNPVVPGNSYTNPPIPGTSNYNPVTPGTLLTSAIPAVPAHSGSPTNVLGVDFPGGDINTPAPLVGFTTISVADNTPNNTISITVPPGGYIIIINI